jgi:hypothetical protein
MLILRYVYLAELQLFTSLSHNTSSLELAESYFELNWPTAPTELETRTETGLSSYWLVLNCPTSQLSLCCVELASY